MPSHDELYLLYVNEIRRRLEAGAHAELEDPHRRFMATLADVRSDRLREYPRRVTSHFHYGDAARAVQEIADPRVKDAPKKRNS